MFGLAYSFDKQSTFLRRDSCVKNDVRRLRRLATLRIEITVVQELLGLSQCSALGNRLKYMDGHEHCNYVPWRICSPTGGRFVRRPNGSWHGGSKDGEPEGP